LKEPAVADSACLIVLDQIGQTGLLFDLFSPVIIPPAVSGEIPRVFEGLHVQRPRNPTASEAFRTHIGAGEAEAIALALEMEDPWVLLDDRRARRVARQFNLRVMGTVGLLLRAKEYGHIPEVKPLLDAALESEFYISLELYHRALNLAEET
jgi:predicted nucleic acid-binding protein